MARYIGLVKQRLGSFMAWKLKHIPRDSNERADALTAVTASILIKKICIPPNLLPADSRELPNNRVKAHKVQVQAV